MFCIQNEKKKLQIKMNEIENILKKLNNCLTEVEMGKYLMFSQAWGQSLVVEYLPIMQKALGVTPETT